MIATSWNLSTAKRVLLAAIGIFGITASAYAVPPTLNTSGLTPQQCYSRDSGCTQFCGNVTDSKYRYECFSICDRMLDNCLETGDWTDSRAVDPGTANPPDPRDQLTAHLLGMLMVLTDRDGDTTISPEEIQSLKESVFEKENANGKKNSPTQQ